MSDSFGNNKYAFTWEIKNFTNEILNNFDSNEIRSPLFTTEHIGGASWYLAIRIKFDDDVNEVFCYLVRNSEDKVNDIVKIQYKVYVTASYTSDEGNKKMLETGVFKRGDLCLGCKFNCTNLFPVTLQCNMIDNLSVNTPLFKCSKVETKAEYFTWTPGSNFAHTIFSGFHGIKYKASVKFMHDRQLVFNVLRSDSENLKVYLMFNLSISCGLITTKSKGDYKGWSIPFEINDPLVVQTSLRFANRDYSKHAQIYITFVTSVLKDSECSTFEEKSALKTNTIDILSDLLRMYESRMHTDVKLTTVNQTFLAHKGILSCRSPVFAAMFHQKDMAEAQTSVVHIKDVDGETLNLLLKYMYTNDIDKLYYGNALKILIAADKYQVISLKDKCATYLLNNLSEENVCEILVATDMIPCIELKSSAVDYVKMHAHNVLFSDYWKQLVKRNSNLVSEILSLISENFGTVLSQYKALKKNECPTLKEKPAPQSNTSNIFSQQLLRMYENKMHTDVKLTNGNRTFPAHKCILSCHSPVFAAMFDQIDMTEAQTGVVDITDVDGTTLNLLLKYMYTYDVDKLHYENALTLLIAADKYQVLSLNEKCATYLLDNLSEENVCEILFVADMISHSDLKLSAVDYVKTHADKVLVSGEWKELVKKDANLVADTLSVISEDFGKILRKHNAREKVKENH